MTGPGGMPWVAFGSGDRPGPPDRQPSAPRSFKVNPPRNVRLEGHHCSRRMAGRRPPSRGTSTDGSGEVCGLGEPEETLHKGARLLARRSSAGILFPSCPSAPRPGSVAVSTDRAGIRGDRGLQMRLLSRIRRRGPGKSAAVGESSRSMARILRRNRGASGETGSADEGTASATATRHPAVVKASLGGVQRQPTTAAGLGPREPATSEVVKGDEPAYVVRGLARSGWATGPGSDPPQGSSPLLKPLSR